MNSIRRHLIDKNLISHVNLFKNKLILDAGGRKNSNRGEFNKDKTDYHKWIYLNLDPSTEPDIVGDISNTNFENEKFDIVLLIEVIEYLNDPSKVFLEINRILKKKWPTNYYCSFFKPTSW